MRHAEVRHAIGHLRAYGAWPLSEADLATTTDGEGARPRIVLCEGGGAYVLGPRGWQRAAVSPPIVPVRMRLRHATTP